MGAGKVKRMAGVTPGEPALRERAQSPAKRAVSLTFIGYTARSRNELISVLPLRGRSLKVGHKAESRRQTGACEVPAVSSPRHARNNPSCQPAVNRRPPLYAAGYRRNSSGRWVLRFFAASASPSYRSILLSLRRRRIKSAVRFVARPPRRVRESIGDRQRLPHLSFSRARPSSGAFPRTPSPVDDFQ